MKIIELKPSEMIHNHYPKYIIKEMVLDLFKIMAGYHISHSGGEYLINISAITPERELTSVGKDILFSYYEGRRVTIRLVKPNDILEYVRK